MKVTNRFRPCQVRVLATIIVIFILTRVLPYSVFLIMTHSLHTTLVVLLLLRFKFGYDMKFTTALCV